jgi:hypothetical protein
MNHLLSLENSFDLIFALAAAIGMLAVLQTFVIGQHYIIPTGVLAITLLLGNVARYGLRGARWAKELLFWCGCLFTAHLFFALFFSKRYPEVLGAAFLPVIIFLFALFAFLSVQYARRNRIFSDD